MLLTRLGYSDTLVSFIKSTVWAACFVAMAATLAWLLQRLTTFLNQNLRHQGTGKTPSEDIFELITSRNWAATNTICTFHPQELAQFRASSATRYTALHHAILFKAPAEVIELMLYQAPKLAYATTADGETALHWAVRLSAPKEILMLLLSANPSSGVMAKDKQGVTPLALVWDRHRKMLLETTTATDLDRLFCWKRILLLLKVSSVCRDKPREFEVVTLDDTTTLPLHIVARCPSPPGLFPFMTNIFRDEMKEKDEHGRLPLAVACCHPVANRASDAQTKIEMLSRVYPLAIFDRDMQGRLPLFLALDSGVEWEEGVNALVEKHPRSIAMRDPVTGLFPFMLAAASSSRTNEQDETKSLSTIFQLLQKDPTVLRRDQERNIM